MTTPLEGEALSRGPSLAEQAYETLKQQIIDGSIVANTVISENVLSRQLAISRSPLREAIRRLQDEKLLDPSGPRGVRVPSITAKFVRDLYNLRRALDVEAARLVEFPDEQTLLKARGRFDDVTAALSEGDTKPFTDADFEFHDLYIRACGNDLLIEHIERLRGPVQRVHAFAKPLFSHVKTSAEEHLDVLNALESKNRRKLCATVEAHIAGVAERLTKYIEEREVNHSA